MPRSTFLPFCFGGRYREHQVVHASETVVLWLLSELPADVVRKAGERLAGTAVVYEKIFGASIARNGPWRVAETSDATFFSERPVLQNEPARIPASVTRYSGSFPGGVLISTPLLELGLGSDAVLKMLEGELAHSWFGFTTEAVPLDGLRWGLANYAVLLAELSREGNQARLVALARYLKRYDEVSARVLQKLPLTSPPPTDDSGEPDWNQRFLLSGRGAFFLIDLEDIVGQKAFQRAILKLVQGGRGHTVNFADLRRAIEAESRKNMGPAFDTWLKSTAIPEEFRSRYSAK